MRANINPETGIPYGVIDARKCQWLWETIVNDGNDDTYTQARDTLEAKIRKETTSSLAEFDGTTPGSKDEKTVAFEVACNTLLKGLRVCDFSNEDIAWCSSELVRTVYDANSGTFCLSEAADRVWSYFVNNIEVHQDYDGSDHVFSWTDPTKRFSYQVSSLGGAPLIWVFKSPYVTPCRQCSPCVPNAGNLDDMMELGAHNCLAYCMDPEEIDDVIARPKVMYYATEYPQTDKPITYLQKETNV
jgi:hypothetical protein